jgi:hypothetical protein
VTEPELRAIVREAIARHLAPGAGVPPEPGRDLRADAARAHPSHGLLPVAAGADTGGPCVIEPAVPCNHCGYCKSLGH